MAKRRTRTREHAAPNAWRPFDPTATGSAAEALRRRAMVDGKEVIDTPCGRAKISDTFVDFAEPAFDLLRHARVADRSRIEQMLEIAWLVWNTQLLAEPERRLAEIRETILKGVPDPDGRVVMATLVDILVERRRTVFRDDRRFITHFQVGPGSDPGEVKIAAAYGASC